MWSGTFFVQYPAVEGHVDVVSLLIFVEMRLQGRLRGPRRLDPPQSVTGRRSNRFGDVEPTAAGNSVLVTGDF